MKKAYVKPVFLAEEFVGVAHVASACGYSISKPAEVYFGVGLCDHKGGNCHTVKNSHGGISGSYAYTYKDEQGNEQQKQMSYWEYAGNSSGTKNGDAFLFTVNNGQCDFLWDSTKNEMGVWNTPDVWTNGDVRPTPDASMLGSVVKWLDQNFSIFFYGSNPSGGGNNDHHPGYNGGTLVS